MLSSNERKVLSAIQHDSRRTVSEVGSQLGMRHHTVSYTLKSLTERGIIRPYILTNPHALGLTDYCIFFNYVGGGKGARSKIIEYCLSSQQAAYFAELSGPYQYTVSLFCRTIFEVTEFFSRLASLLPGSAFESSFALRLRFAQILGRWFDSGAVPEVLDRCRTDKECVIDDVDRRIVGFYSQNAGVSLQKVAAFAGVSESTVRNRLAALENSKVIQPFAYFVDVSKIGVTTFRIILSARGMEQSFPEKIFKYMIKHPRASAFVHCIGAWDFELNFDLEERSEMGSIIEEFTDTFGDNIREMHTVSEIIVHRAHHFPINAGVGAS